MKIREELKYPPFYNLTLIKIISEDYELLLTESKKISTYRLKNNEEVIEGNGALASAPFIEPHIHLDTTLTAGEPEWNKSGTLFEGIERWSQRKEFLTKKKDMQL